MNAPANTSPLTHARARTAHAETAGEASQALMQLMMGAWASQIAGTLARLCVFDEIASGHTDAAAIAKRIHVEPHALHRALRAASTVGLLRATGTSAFELTARGELLRGDVPGSMRALLDAETAPAHWLPWGRLEECIRTGQTVAAETLGFSNLWNYYKAHPEEGEAFSLGMSGISSMVIGAVSAAWKPPAARRIVDVGGAHGAFLGWVLNQLPDAKGQLLDLPHVIETAKPALRAAGLSNRVECVAGDFLKSVPAGGDLYLLKHIVHNWDDESVRILLGNVSQAMAPGGTVAVVEALIPEDGSPSPASLMDVNMLVMLTGKERSEPEIRHLFATAGLALTRVVQTPSPFSLLEARKA